MQPIVCRSVKPLFPAVAVIYYKVFRQSAANFVRHRPAADFEAAATSNNRHIRTYRSLLKNQLLLGILKLIEITIEVKLYKTFQVSLAGPAVSAC